MYYILISLMMILAIGPDEPTVSPDAGDDAVSAGTATATVMVQGTGATAGQLPFWATAGQYGLMPENNGAMALIQLRNDFDGTRLLQWRAGASIASSCETELPMTPKFMIDELYGSLRWKVLTLDVGSKRRDMDFYGADPSVGSLSVTGGHIAESGNARTMPGYNLSHAPVTLPFTRSKVRVWGEWGDYKTMDERFVKDALVHRTKIGLSWDIVPRLSFNISLDHYALWGGHHPDGMDIDVTFVNYLRVVTGSHAGTDGNDSDRFNVIGDQGGAETFAFTWRGDGWNAELRHDIPYADGSGMGFQNWPDGVNTLHLSFDCKDRWVSDILYEYHYTMWQSGTVNGEIFDKDGNSLTPPGVKTTGLDNYFNNYFYASGWTHFGRPIGSPLLFPAGTRDGSWWRGATGSATGKIFGIENNRYKANHIGIGGKLWHRHPYRLMLTFSKNYGTYGKPYEGESQINKPWGSVDETGLSQFSAAFNGSIDGIFSETHCNSQLSLTYGIYCDRGEILPNNFGLSLGIRYTL